MKNNDSIIAQLGILGGMMLCASQPIYANSNLNKDLQWVVDAHYSCGGYYQDTVLPPTTQNSVNITSNQLEINEFGVSSLTGDVTLTYDLRQVIAHHALVYRDIAYKKLTKIMLLEGLKIFDPEILIIAQQGEIDFNAHRTHVAGLIYRSILYGGIKNFARNRAHIRNSSNYAHSSQDKLYAWGKAAEYTQNKNKVHTLRNASYSTCPPSKLAWQVQASELIFNNMTGRGQAHNLVLFIDKIPIFYAPYLSFPLDDRRTSGFLWPNLGVIKSSSGYFGYYFSLPIYLNLAPNYDVTITPIYYHGRGVAINNLLRYMTNNTRGALKMYIMPNDEYFLKFKRQENDLYDLNTNTYKHTALQRLLHANSFRKSLYWQQHTKFNENWLANIDYNYVGDDYIFADFTQNFPYSYQTQLLQQGEVQYSNKYWDFIGRIQGYQTLHPVNIDTVFMQQYIRLPQLLVNGTYSTANGWDYFINGEDTNFAYQKLSGDLNSYPTGNRANLQVGIAKSFAWPFAFIQPRVQLALTRYDLNQSNSINVFNRSLPIVDVHSGLYLQRDVNIAATKYRQTLEPEMYYVYIPYRKQNQLPLFDTTVNQLNYAQLFSYNIFTGIDRINDANQLSVGLSSRLFEFESGLEKMRASAGEIVYFHPRRISLCQQEESCMNDLGSRTNTSNLSVLVAELSFKINKVLSGSSNILWNPITHNMANENISIQYQPDESRMISLKFSYVSDSLVNPNILNNNSRDNILKLTDINVHWPINDRLWIVGHWSEDWHTLHFQNIFYGLQYNSCCWSVQFATGRTLSSIQDNRPQYSNQIYLQIALTGLGSVGANGNLTTALGNNVANYEKTYLEQDI